MNKKISDILLDILIGILLIACVFMIVLRTCFIKVHVDGYSMNPTIVDQSEGYMLKVNENTTIHRFDVVASEYNASDDYYIIKRVLGLPGETISLTDNVLYVNGEEVSQDFNFNPQSNDYKKSTWVLNDDEYLIAGDNRSHTIVPQIVKKSDLICINGFSYSNPEGIRIYFFKDGI